MRQERETSNREDKQGKQYKSHLFRVSGSERVEASGGMRKIKQREENELEETQKIERNQEGNTKRIQLSRFSGSKRVEASEERV